MVVSFITFSPHLKVHFLKKISHYTIHHSVTFHLVLLLSIQTKTVFGSEKKNCWHLPNLVNDRINGSEIGINNTSVAPSITINADADWSIIHIPQVYVIVIIQTSERSCSLYLIQRQIGGSHNAYFKQESSLYLLLKEIQLFVWLDLHFVSF